MLDPAVTRVVVERFAGTPQPDRVDAAGAGVPDGAGRKRHRPTGLDQVAEQEQPSLIQSVSVTLERCRAD